MIARPTVRRGRLTMATLLACSLGLIAWEWSRAQTPPTAATQSATATAPAGATVPSTATASPTAASAVSAAPTVPASTATTTSTSAVPATTSTASATAATSGPALVAPTTDASPKPTTPAALDPATGGAPPTSPPSAGEAAPNPTSTGPSIQVGEVQVAEKTTGGLDWWKLLMVAAVFIGPIFLGRYLSRVLRMPDHGTRFYFVLFAIFAGVAVTRSGWPPKLGIDLKGGVSLVYEISEEAKKEGKEVDDKLVGTIKKRLDPSAVREIDVSSLGSDQVEVTVPNPGDDAESFDGQEELDRIMRLIGTTGALEFRITASEHKYKQVIEAADAQEARERQQGGFISKNVSEQLPDGKIMQIGEWVTVKPAAAEGIEGRGVYKTRRVNVDNKEELQVLVVIGPPGPNGEDLTVRGEDIVSTQTSVDERLNPQVEFTFNAAGSRKFGALTGAHVPKGGQESHLAVILDKVLQSAPALHSRIDDRGRITGNFTEEEANDLSEILSAGRLNVALNRTPISDDVVGATLGEDTIASGVRAMYVATGVVIVFMVIYYRFAGLVANIALLLNVLLTVSFMIMFNAAFTLAGLAGLALTVGMAVDANVLIYERMREELSRGATLRMAIRNGFDRASTTIIDANLTTLITAVVLYVIGTDQIKGFAVTLTVGIVMNLFTAITCSRLMFDIAERNRWIGNLKFMQIMSQTNFDFIGKRYACYALSVLLLGIGLVGVVARGKHLFNIDFIGGVSVTMVLKDEPKQDGVAGKTDAQKIAEVREKIATRLPEATVQAVEVKDYPNTSGYKIVTSPSSAHEQITMDEFKTVVEGEIKAMFGDQLARYQMTYDGMALAAVGSNLTLPPPVIPKLTPASENPPSTVSPTATPAVTTPTSSTASAATESTSTPANTAPAASTAPSTPPATRPNAVDGSAIFETEFDVAEASSCDPAIVSPNDDPVTPTATKPAPSVPATTATKTTPTATTSTAQATPSVSPTATKPMPSASPPVTATPSPTTVATVPAPRPSPTVAATATMPAATAITSTPTAPVATLPTSTMPAPVVSTLPSSIAPPAGVTTTTTPSANSTETALSAVTLKLTFNPAISFPKLNETAKSINEGDGGMNLKYVIFREDYNPESNSNVRRNEWNLRIETTDRAQATEFLNRLNAKLADAPFFPSSNKKGEKFAGNARTAATFAMIVGLGLVLLYVWFRFQDVAFGFAAIVALIHDVLFTVGCLALSSWLAGPLGFALVDPFKIDLTIVAALLTIIGYSINDTIVIFDRIREVRGKSPNVTAELINTCLNQTLSRTILTSLTVFMVVLIMYIWGGAGIHGFAFALVVGTMSGTYSTIYVASPILLWLFRKPNAAAAAKSAARAAM